MVNHKNLRKDANEEQETTEGLDLDFYVDFEDDLESDGISVEEEGFMQGFNEDSSD